MSEYTTALKSERHVNMAKHARRYGFDDSVRYHEYFADAWRRAEAEGLAGNPDFVPEPMPKPFELDGDDGDDDPPGCWECGAPVTYIDQLCPACDRAASQRDALEDALNRA